jgi:hypothetical protein
LLALLVERQLHLGSPPCFFNAVELLLMAQVFCHLSSFTLSCARVKDLNVTHLRP